MHSLQTAKDILNETQQKLAYGRDRFVTSEDMLLNMRFRTRLSINYNILLMSWEEMKMICINMHPPSDLLWKH